MTTRELFQSKGDLGSWLKSVVSSGNWQQTMIYARAAIMEQKPDQKVMEGAMLMERTLMELGHPDEPTGFVPSSGMRHDLDVIPKVEPTQKPKRGKKK